MRIRRLLLAATVTVLVVLTLADSTVALAPPVIASPPSALQAVLVFLVVRIRRRVVERVPTAAAELRLSIELVVGKREEGRVGADDLLARRQLRLAIWR